MSILQYVCARSLRVNKQHQREKNHHKMIKSICFPYNKISMVHIDYGFCLYILCCLLLVLRQIDSFFFALRMPSFSFHNTIITIFSRLERQSNECAVLMQLKFFRLHRVSSSTFLFLYLCNIVSMLCVIPKFSQNSLDANASAMAHNMTIGSL